MLATTTAKLCGDTHAASPELKAGTAAHPAASRIERRDLLALLGELTQRDPNALPAVNRRPCHLNRRPQAEPLTAPPASSCCVQEHKRIPLRRR